MSNHLHAPDAFRWTTPSTTSVNLTWRAVDHAKYYDIRGGGTTLTRRVNVPSALIKGLPESSDHDLEVRAVGADGSTSQWASVNVITTIGIPQYPAPLTYIRILDTDRQSFRMTLPTTDGKNIDCFMAIWWQPSDNGWWVSFEAPVGTPIVSSRRLCLNCGVLGALKGAIAGDIIVRMVDIGGTDEPDRLSFVRDTHRLAWEATT